MASHSFRRGFLPASSSEGEDQQFQRAGLAPPSHHGSCLASLGLDQLIQKHLSVQRRHASETGRGYCLAVNVIGYIADSEYAEDAGLCGHTFEAGLNFYVAVLHVQLAFEQIGVKFMADSDKNAR